MKENNVILLLGSNINPEENILRALELLGQQAKLTGQSRIWETEAVGSNGPNFLNIAIRIQTPLNSQEIKFGLIDNIESELKRVRTTDKYAPRTMDIDIILFNGQVVDENLWNKAFIAIPVAEMEPNLPHPSNGKSLKNIAVELKNSAFAELFDLSIS